MKPVRESLNQFNDYKFFNLLEKVDENEKKNMEQKEKDGQAILKKLLDNFKRFQSAAGGKLIKYKEFWEENKEAIQQFDGEARMYKMYDSDYIAGVLDLPDEALEDELIDSELEGSEVEEFKEDEGKEEDKEHEDEETPEEEDKEEETEPEEKDKEEETEPEEDKEDTDKEEDDEKINEAEKPVTKEEGEAVEGPTFPEDEVEIDGGNPPEGEEPDLDLEPPTSIGDAEKDEAPEEEAPESPDGEGIEAPAIEDDDFEVDAPEEKEATFVVYDMVSGDREEIFRCRSKNVMKNFDDFYENTFKGAIKSLVNQAREEKEAKQREIERIAKEKQDAAKRGKLDKFLAEGKKVPTTKAGKEKKFDKVVGEMGKGKLKTSAGKKLDPKNEKDRKQGLAIAFSESGQSKKKLDEVFGLSQKEKDFKQLKQDIESAKKEISKYNFNRFISIPGDDATPQHKQELIDIRIRQVGDELEYLKKILPNLFTPKQNRYDANWKSDKIFHCQIPEKWYFILDDKKFVDNEKAKAKLTEMLNKLTNTELSAKDKAERDNFSKYK